MKPIAPTPYIAAYEVLVFLAPWLVFMNFNLRKLLYARRTGISLLSRGAAERIRSLRQTDPYAAHLHQRLVLWLKITLIMWFVGFTILGLTLYLLHSRGVV
jgi:hypothetical protein